MPSTSFPVRVITKRILLEPLHSPKSKHHLSILAHKVAHFTYGKNTPRKQSGLRAHLPPHLFLLPLCLPGIQSINSPRSSAGHLIFRNWPEESWSVKARLSWVFIWDLQGRASLGSNMQIHLWVQWCEKNWRWGGKRGNRRVGLLWEKLHNILML
jgi:hypothetical protein